MRSITLLAIILAFAAGAAFADFGEILKSWNTPKIGSIYGTCWGLGWDGEYIWCNVSHSYVEDWIYRCMPSDGSVVSSFKSGFHNYLLGRGMCHRQWRGAPCLEVAVWDVRQEKPYLNRYRYNGSIVNSTLLPFTFWVPSVVFDATNDWVVRPVEGGSVAFKLDGNGSPISSFTVKRPGPAYGLTKQVDFFWFVVGGYMSAYKTRSNGSVVASFATLGTASDCTYENKHLWVSTGSTITCYDVSNAPAVLPASVGRVKALFR